MKKYIKVTATAIVEVDTSWYEEDDDICAVEESNLQSGEIIFNEFVGLDNGSVTYKVELA